MKRILVLALALSVSTAAVAQESVVTGQVEDVSCEVVAVSGSAAGAGAGAVVGSIAGGILGDALFGKSGRGLGGLIGGVGGGFAGESIASTKTYKCVLAARTTQGTVYLETVGKPYNVGQSVILVRGNNGEYFVRP